jgi:hypothetical protein
MMPCSYGRCSKLDDCVEDMSSQHYSCRSSNPASLSPQDMSRTVASSSLSVMRDERERSERVSECMCVCGSECASVSEETCGWCCWDEMSAALDAPPSDTAHLRCPLPLRCPPAYTQEKWHSPNKSK